MSKVILIRGAQGSGKTTLGRRFIFGVRNSILLETDQYFTDRDGNYNWDRSKLADAHEDCLRRFKNAVNEQELVVVANTFVLPQHIKPYIEYAENMSVPVVIYRLTSEHTNIHNVPEDIVKRTRDALNNPQNWIIGEVVI